MAAENAEIVRAASDAWNRGDVNAAYGLIDPEVEVEVAMDSPLDGTYQGLEGLLQFLGEFWGQFESYRSELTECIAVGDDVFLAVRHTGTGKGSGASVEMPGWQVCTIRDGRIVRWRNLKTRSDALAAAGLPK
jgi:ketosteroid isomerase-like protein